MTDDTRWRRCADPHCPAAREGYYHDHVTHREDRPMIRIDGSYVWLRPATATTRTVHVRPDLLVDLLPDGRVAGVERVGAPVTAVDLAAVLAAVPFEETTDDTR